MKMLSLQKKEKPKDVVRQTAHKSVYNNQLTYVEVGEKAEECDLKAAVLETEDQLFSDAESYDEEDDKADSNSATNDKELETVTGSKKTPLGDELKIVAKESFVDLIPIRST
ncbi:hypothetical protein GQX74_012399 [Glossina fuscipes]|nr:hypothetical protein GQX74_012399 [Glossina fuscipes]